MTILPTDIKRPRCFLDVQIGDSGEIGRIVCEMFVDKTPKTCENFMELCKGERVSEFTGRELKYKGCKFHKVKKGFMLASGDFVNGTGFSGESIYGPKFDDESFELKHDRSGLLSMSNMGPNSNSSVFHIMTAKAHFLNKTNVVFGRVINGMNFVRKIENLPKNKDNSTTVDPVTIVACGVLGESEPDGVPPPADGDEFPDHPDDFELYPTEHPQEFLTIAHYIKEQKANPILKEALATTDDAAAAKALFEKAIAKYEKVIMYLEAVSDAPEIVHDYANQDLFMPHRYEPTLSYEEQVAYYAILVSSLSNLSMCYLKIENWAKSQATSERILSIGTRLKTYTEEKPNLPLSITDRDKGKALFRLGHSMVKQVLHCEDGLLSLYKALKLLPGDKVVIQSIKEAQEIVNKRREKQRYAYGQIWNRDVKEPEIVKEPETVRVPQTVRVPETVRHGPTIEELE